MLNAPNQCYPVRFLKRAVKITQQLGKSNLTQEKKFPKKRERINDRRIKTVHTQSEKKLTGQNTTNM